MPNALAIANTEHKDLKSLPGGFVVIKRMTYGQKLERQGMIRIQFGMSRQRQSDVKGEMEMANKIATQFEFKNCIVDHNLTDENDNKLDLSNPVVIDNLDPRVGEEINTLISEINNFEEDSGN